MEVVPETPETESGAVGGYKAGGLVEWIRPPLPSLPGTCCCVALRRLPAAHVACFLQGATICVCPGSQPLVGINFHCVWVTPPRIVSLWHNDACIQGKILAVL